MAEPESPSNQPSPEVQLFARLKLQRVVFGAFAIVLVSVFALGLSAYRHMQSERDAARQAEREAREGESIARSEQHDREQDLRVAAADLTEAKRRLALDKCRIAMHEIRDGNAGRARNLLAEARELEPPPWWPLVEHLSRERAVRFEGSEIAGEPVIAGAISRDPGVVAVARLTQGGVVVELYGARDGKLLLAYPPVGTGAEVVGRLLLSGDGRAWFLTIPGHAYYGALGATVEVAAGPIADWGAVAPLDAACNDDLSIVYEVYGNHGLVVRKRDDHQQWTTAIITLDLESPAIEAVCLAGDKPVVATGRGIYLVGAGGRTGLLHPLQVEADRYALHAGVGVVYAALLTGRTLEIVAVKPGEIRHVTTTRIELPDEPVEDLRFLCDDSVVWIGRAGRVACVDFAGARQWLLGDHTLSFIGRHEYGLVFANRKGELSLLAQPELIATGMPLHQVPPEFSARPTAHGFILAAPGMERFVLQQERVSGHLSPANIELSRDGAAWVDGQLVLPDGTSSSVSGVLIGAFADGSVLLFSAPNKLRLISGQQVAEFLLAGDRAPDAIAVAAEANVAALRVGDSVYIADMERDPRPVAGRSEVAPDLIALDAGARTLAIAYGPSVLIHNLREGAERTVRTWAPPRQIALLFGGSVLVTIEAGELVFYEAEAGHELFRSGEGVSDMAASGEDSLNLIVGGKLQELKLGR